VLNLKEFVRELPRGNRLIVEFVRNLEEFAATKPTAGQPPHRISC